MQTLSLFSAMSLFTKKPDPTLKASPVSEIGITPFPVPRLQHDTVSFSPKIRSGGRLTDTAKGIIRLAAAPYLEQGASVAGIKEQLQSELALEPYSRRPLHAGLLLQEVDNKSRPPQDPPALTNALEELQTVLFKHYPFLEERGLLEEKVLLEERGQNPLTYFDESLLPRVVFFPKGVSGEVRSCLHSAGFVV